MKRWKKIVATVLSAGLVLGMLPMNVLAETEAAQSTETDSSEVEIQTFSDDMQAVTLGEDGSVNMTTEITDENGGLVYYTFTPEITDVYYFFSEGDEVQDKWVILSDEDNNVLEDTQGMCHDYWFAAEMTAGKAYTLAIGRSGSAGIVPWMFKLKHKVSQYTEITKNPTCIEKGVGSGVCDFCNAEVTVEMDLTEHSYEEEVLREGGQYAKIVEYTCSTCGKHYKAKFVPEVESIPEITMGSEGYALISGEVSALGGGGESLFVKYTPEKTGDYRFYSAMDDMASWGYVYHCVDGIIGQMAYLPDDMNGGFDDTLTLRAGITYIFNVVIDGMEFEGEISAYLAFSGAVSDPEPNEEYQKITLDEDGTAEFVVDFSDADQYQHYYFSGIKAEIYSLTTESEVAAEIYGLLSYDNNILEVWYSEGYDSNIRMILQEESLCTLDIAARSAIGPVKFKVSVVHNYTDVVEYTKEPTCTEDGEAIVKCEFCDATIQEVEYAKGHQFGNGGVVLSEGGLHEKKVQQTCGICGETTVSAQIPDVDRIPEVTADEEGNLSVPSEITVSDRWVYFKFTPNKTEGYTYYVEDNSFEVFGDMRVYDPASGGYVGYEYNWWMPDVQFNDTYVLEKGTTYIFSACTNATDNVGSFTLGLKVGHWMSDQREVQEATCLDNSKAVGTCEFCGANISKEYQYTALGHALDENNVCTRCGVSKAEQEKIAEEYINKDNGTILEEDGMDAVATVEENIVKMVGTVFSTIVSDASDVEDVKVEGAALTAYEYSQKSTEYGEYRAKVEIDIVEPEAGAAENEIIFDINLSVLKYNLNGYVENVYTDVEPSAPLRITFKLPKEWRDKDLTGYKLKHYLDDGTVEDLEYIVDENGYITFVTTSLSEFKLMEEKTVEEHEHTWDAGVITKKATCAAEGVKTYTCTECKATYTETIAKTSTHTWDTGVVTKKATCAAEGVKTYTCTECKATYTETIAKTSTHTWDTGVVTKKATCVERGVKTYTCSVCKATKTEEIAIDAANHTGKTVVKDAKEATEKAEGYTGDTYCASCGELLTRGSVIPRKEAVCEHSYKAKFKWSGVTSCKVTYTCKSCGDTIVKNCFKITSKRVEATKKTAEKTVYTAYAFALDANGQATRTVITDTKTVVSKHTGLLNYKYSDGNFYYLLNGMLCNLTTIAKNSKGWWYVKDGKVDFTYTGVAQRADNKTWWYVKRGKVDFTYNGVAKRVDNNTWWYVQNGRVTFGFTGIAKNPTNNTRWYCKNGKVQFDYTGYVWYNFYRYYVVKGKVY